MLNIVFIKYTEVRSRYHPDKEGMLVSDGLSLGGETVPRAPAGPKCGRKILKWNLPNHPCWRWCRLFFCKAVFLSSTQKGSLWSCFLAPVTLCGSVSLSFWKVSSMRPLCGLRASRTAGFIQSPLLRVLGSVWDVWTKPESECKRVAMQ